MTVEPHEPHEPDDHELSGTGEERSSGEDAQVLDLPVGRKDPSVRRPGEGQVHPSVLRMRAVGAHRSVEDAELISATTDVVDAVRAAVLERRGLGGAELNKTQTASLEQEVRNLAIAELQLAVGLGVTEARTMVTAATSPEALLTVIDQALRSGEASWPLVRAFFEKSTGLSAEQRMLVAVALFGEEAALAHEDRLDPDGRLHRTPWGHARFKAALDGEVTACESTDPDAERERRAKAYARRRTTLKVHDDGTATLRITGPAATMVAADQRIDRAARTLRRSGDERNLDQLRADTANGKLLYGTITMPEPGEDGLFDETLAPEDIAHIARVVNALPLVQLQVVVPFNALSGGFPLCAGCARPTAHPDTPGPNGSPSRGRQESSAPQESSGRQGSSAPQESYGPQGSSPPQESPAHRGSPSGAAPSEGPPTEPGPHPDSPPDPKAAEPDRPHPPPDPESARIGRRPARGPVAEVLGPHPFFITDGHARELALFPGTTLHRLVVDPRDGRLVERTIQTYRPDTDMRRQVIAADVHSRAPGSRLGAHAGELDHVTPYGWAGGPTNELNLALLAKRPHQFKTDGAWKAAINDRRDLTITTVLGQVARTRVHDYRAYLRTRHPEDLDARRDLANRLVYAALAEHPTQRDGSTARPDRRLGLDWTSPNGATYEGPSPTHPRLDDLLGDEVTGEGSCGGTV